MQIPTAALEALGAQIALSEFRRARIEQGKAKLASAPKSSTKQI